MKRLYLNRIAVVFLALAQGLPLMGRGQVDTCIVFGGSPALPHRQLLPGWTAIPDTMYGMGNLAHPAVYASVPDYAGMNGDPVHHSWPQSLVVDHVPGGVFAVMPDLGVDYGAEGAWMQFWYCTASPLVYVDVGYLTDATDSTTFVQLKRFHGYDIGRAQTASDIAGGWHPCAVDLSLVPTGARLAFRVTDLLPYWWETHIDDVRITSNPCGAWGLKVVRNDTDSLTLRWEEAGTPVVSIHLDADDGTSWTDTLPGGTTEYTLAWGGMGYVQASLTAQCGAEGDNCSWLFSVRTEASNINSHHCVDGYGLNTLTSQSFYGTTFDPWQERGLGRVFVTSSSGDYYIYDHHYNTEQAVVVELPRRWYLRIPPGADYSIGLGYDHLGTHNGAAMLHTFTVDTAEASLLVFKYAALAKIGTDSTRAPSFDVVLLDDTLGSVGQGPCYSVHLNSYDSTGWELVQFGHRVIGWSSLGMDLRPFHGRKMNLSVTTRDGTSYCNAYYSVECTKIHECEGEGTVGCEADSVELSVPWGFRYRWWREGDTSTLDTTQTLTVPTGSGRYFCELSHMFNPECRMVMSRRALARPEVVVHDTVVENQLPRSFMGHIFASATDTTMVLPNDDGCDTLLHYMLHVFENQYVRLERRVCASELPLEWEGHGFAKADSVTFTLTDVHGADSVVTLVLLVDSIVHARAFHSVDGEVWADTVPIVLCSNQTLLASDSTLWASSWRWTLTQGADTIETQWSASSSFAFRDVDTLLQGHLTLEAGNTSCADTLLWPLAVLPSPTADFVWFPEPVDMDPETEFTNLSDPADNVDFLWLIQREQGGVEVDSFALAGPFRYRWPGDLPQGNFDVELMASLTYPLSYLDTLLLSPSTHVCTDTARRTVTIATSLLQFPNLVTPNGDGINDRWRIVNLLEYGLFSMNELWIYSRWGNLVYHVRDIHDESQFWDPDNPFCPDGTYYYRFSAKSLHGLVRCNGTIEVLR
ncbi:MAG: gliding motility-associated C-terminal domain-containing protein [Bacteroidales bacterium]|nr:gliding motility-associated C-terminal domain-containing protein [Bacteroidales bacterium]